MAYKSDKGALIKKIKAGQKRAVDRAAKKAADIARGLCLKESGKLAASIEPQGKAGAEANGYSIEIGSNLPYAQIQELGPSDGRPYKHKPYLRPALERVQAEMPGILAEEIKL